MKQNTPRQLTDTGCKNGSVVTSLNGLNYTQYCEHDLKGQILSSGDAANFQECIDSCTRYGPVCFGVSWDRVKRTCNRKPMPTNTSDLVEFKPPFTIDAALVFQAQYDQDPADFPCPYPNLSVQKTKSGPSFKIFCGGLFLDWGPYALKSKHVQTMDECLDYCAQSHPLCTAAIFHSNLVGSGWLNCRLVGAPYRAERTNPYTRTMAHSAELVLHLPEKPAWKDKSVQKDNSGRLMKISRSDLRDLNTTEALPSKIHHEESIENCMQRCADDNATCVSAVYDHGLQSGYQNCYLFRKLPPPRDRNSDYTFMYLEELSAEFRGPPAKTAGHWSAGRIVGMSLGSFAALAAVVGLIVLYRKRKTGNGKKFKFT